MAKDIYVPARIIGGKIPVKASLGQTVIVTEGPETYTGPVTVTPTESEQALLTKDKLVTDNVTVNPIPSEYVIPTGSMSITENGQYDVTEKASVTVDVPAPVPTGTIEITENGTYDVTEMAQALVNVSAPQKVFVGSFVYDESQGQDISLPCPFKPDIFIMHNPEKLDGYTPASGSAIWAMVIAPFIGFAGRKSTAGALTSVASWVLPNTTNRPGLSYSDGNVTVRLSLSNNNQMVVGRTYEYIFIKSST